MSRKVFISVLGTSNYQECKYIADDYTSKLVRFIQEATLEYLTSGTSWTESDCAYILLTSKAYECNWVDDGQCDREGKVIHQAGLSTRLHNMNLPFPIKTLNRLPIGNNENEIWNVFERIYQVLEEGDELYFDLTHGFRYLPMLVLVLGNYAQHLKNVKIKSITYGNFEGRNIETNEALIVNLLSLSAVQDWAFAAGQYLHDGNPTTLCELCSQELSPILRAAQGKDRAATALRRWNGLLNEVSKERQTCRGESIITSSTLQRMRTETEQIRAEIIPPLVPIFDHIQNSMNGFDTKENLNNAFFAAEWCCKNGLYQQSITLLQEYLVSVLCEKNGFDRLEEEKRDLINKALNIVFMNTEEGGWIVNDSDKVIVRQLLQDQWISNKCFARLYADISDTRNDKNHSGMRSRRQPLSPIQIERKIRGFLQKCKQLFLEQ